MAVFDSIKNRVIFKRFM